MDYKGTAVQGFITRLYHTASRAYGAIPHHFSKSGRAFPPWHYFFEITRRCNLRCKMCQYIDWLQTVPTSEQRKDELTTQEWHDVIDQTTPLSLITFTGGEVWIRKDFPELLQHAARKRRVHFITNAVLLNEARAKDCVDLAPRRLGGKGLNFIGVSIDGTESIHDIVRAKKGAFKQTADGIRALAEHRRQQNKKYPLVHLNTVIVNDNIDVLPEMPQLADELGISVLNLLTEMRSFDNQDFGFIDPATIGAEDLNIPVLDRPRLDGALRATFKNAARLGIEVRAPRMPYEMLLDHYDNGYDITHMACSALWNNLVVGSKGGVYPACFMKNIGNVRESTLEELWNSPEAKAFRSRRRSAAFEACRGCCEMEHKSTALERSPASITDQDSASPPSATDRHAVTRDTTTL